MIRKQVGVIMIMKIVIEMRYYTILYKRVRTGFFGANAPRRERHF